MPAYSCSVAITGAGYMAREHIRAFQNIPGVRVAGIMSRTLSRALTLAHEFSIPHVCSNMAELHAATSANLVVIAVPELAANAVIHAATEYPWTILAEKPVGYCLADAEDISAHVTAQKRRLFVALNRRFYSATQTVLRNLANTPSPRFIELFDQEDPIAALNAGAPAKVVQYWMYANSIHIIDYFCGFGRGEIAHVEKVVPWNSNAPAHVVAVVHFTSGDMGIYHGIWNGPGPWACVVSTPEKRWEMRPLEQVRYQNAGERHLVDVETAAWDTEFKAGMRLQAEEAVKAALGLPSLSVPLEEANRSMRLVHDIYGQ